jgi:hypothetical protein
MKRICIIGIISLVLAGSVQAGTEASVLLESARMAVEQGRYKEALQDLAQITIGRSRDGDWIPAALFYEGMVYKQTGRPEAAAYVAEELTVGWPSSDWSRRAEELK